MDHLADLKHFITEARKLDDDQVEYSEKMVKGKVDRVVAVLKSTKSAAATRLAKNYRNLQRLLKEVEEEKAAQNSLIKEVVDEFFDPSDEVTTRVIESIQYVMTFSKVTHKPADSTDVTDYEAIFNELNASMPQLASTLAVLLKKHTKTKITPAKTVPTRLSVSHKDEIKTPAKKAPKNESLYEDGNFAAKYAQLAQEKFNDFDRVLAKLKT